ncbi:hypothetical protein K7X08_006495 [Anisodus acutangulus]|uniref:Uncharacterized protein n=1 Tax=Anisodus acutangulus TaxID=402998 RepID=A0A9Q1MZT1_9SOLA|nr:hypothetical protein K7X08_006495 [Anisodus acutangulus]
MLDPRDAQKQWHTKPVQTEAATKVIEYAKNADGVVVVATAAVPCLDPTAAEAKAAATMKHRDQVQQQQKITQPGTSITPERVDSTRRLGTTSYGELVQQSTPSVGTLPGASLRVSNNVSPLIEGYLGLQRMISLLMGGGVDEAADLVGLAENNFSMEMDTTT